MIISVPIDRIVPLTDARDNFSRLVVDVESTDEGLYVLTKGGKPAIALVNIKYLEEIMAGKKGAEMAKPDIKPAVTTPTYEPKPIAPPPPKPPSTVPPLANPSTPPIAKPSINPPAAQSQRPASYDVKPQINPSWRGDSENSRTSEPPKPAVTPQASKTPVNPWPIPVSRPTPAPVPPAQPAPVTAPVTPPLSSPAQPASAPAAPTPPPPVANFTPPTPVMPSPPQVGQNRTTPVPIKIGTNNATPLPPPPPTPPSAPFGTPLAQPPAPTTASAPAGIEFDEAPRTISDPAELKSGEIAPKSPMANAPTESSQPSAPTPSSVQDLEI